MPPSTTRTKPIQDLIDTSVGALSREAWFEAERLLDRALSMSHGRHDFEGMIEIVEHLKTARMARRKDSLGARAAVRLIDDCVTDTMNLERGRYMIQPPLVGADARRLRLLALSREIPVAVICREPMTQLGQTPIVAIGALGSIRTRIDSPDDPDKPNASWFRGALDALGAASRELINPDKSVDRRIEAILGCLDTIPEDDLLHDMLVAACREAAQTDA